MQNETKTDTILPRSAARFGLLAALMITSASSMLLSGCLAAAVGAGAGVGYAVGHENGEDHVRDGEHGDDD